jgi:hypothetical protein
MAWALSLSLSTGGQDFSLFGEINSVFWKFEINCEKYLVAQKWITFNFDVKFNKIIKKNLNLNILKYQIMKIANNGSYA